MDTIELIVTQEQAGNLRVCLPFLTNLKQTYIQNSGQTYITGHAGNLRTSVSENRVKISGSLSKFYNGNNLYNLSRTDCKLAFEKMADTFHLPIHTAKVTKVDIGFNIITDCKPELYYPHFGPSSNYERYAQPNSIRYENSLRVIRVYDKLAECKKNKVEIPKEFVGRNLMRIEIGYRKRLTKQFNHAFITPEVLTDEDFYTYLVNSWYKEYLTIHKVGIPNFMSYREEVSAKDFWKLAKALAIYQLGPEFLLNYAEELKAKNSFTNDRGYYRVRKEIKNLIGGSFSETPSLVQEIDNKTAILNQSHR